MATYPIKARIDRTISPKDAIPSAILEQSPWHWDAQKTDHQDGNSFMFTIVLTRCCVLEVVCNLETCERDTCL